MSDQFFGGDFGPPADDPNDPESRDGEGEGDEFDAVGLDAPDEFVEEGDAVYAALLARLGEAAPQPRLSATRRAVELLGDPQRAYSVIHLTATNGKTSTSRITESILRAYGLRTGLFTSPHLERLNERIMIDGRPISNEALAANWRDIEPFLELVDGELEAAGEPRLTFFEALTVLAFASFAEAPVDVAVIEVGMGGEWDSTNVADGQVAVFTPISLDHTARLGNTVEEIARTKSGIVKPAAQVVSAVQPAGALAELARAAELSESTLAVEGEQFALESSTVAVGGQLVTIRGLAGRYEELFLPLYGTHQGHNAAGAEALAGAVKEFFTFDKVVAVVAVLADKDVAGIIRALDPVVDEFVVTTSSSDRAIDPDELASTVVAVAGADRVVVETELRDALDQARELAGESEQGAVLVTGSITLVGEVIGIAAAEEWK